MHKDARKEGEMLGLISEILMDVLVIYLIVYNSLQGSRIDKLSERINIQKETIDLLHSKTNILQKLVESLINKE